MRTRYFIIDFGNKNVTYNLTTNNLINRYYTEPVNPFVYIIINIKWMYIAIYTELCYLLFLQELITFCYKSFVIISFSIKSILSLYSENFSQ